MSKQAFDYVDDGDPRDETTPWEVIVCAGPPKCLLQGHSAVIAAFTAAREGGVCRRTGV